MESDLLNLRDPSQAAAWDLLTQPVADIFPGDFAPSESDANGAIRAAISGAACKFIQLFFCNNRATQRAWCAKADEVLNTTMAFVGDADKAEYPIPFKQGEQIASMVSWALMCWTGCCAGGEMWLKQGLQGLLLPAWH